MTLVKNYILSALCLFGAMTLSSCESLFDGSEDCSTGVALNFVYDYHMEPGANAFPANVDCVDVLVFDNNGNFITNYIETGRELMNDNYTMDLPLPLGKYHLVVYGGLACNNPSFSFSPDWHAESTVKKENISVSLPLDASGASSNMLHDIDQRTGGLFYGTLDVEITKADLTTGPYRLVTVNMMKDTNNIQVILQQLKSPYVVDHNDFNFKIEDDNFTLDGFNNPVTSRSDGVTPHYLPFARDNRVMGYVEPGVGNGYLAEEDENLPVQVACAEFSTSRLCVSNASKARLIVNSATKQDENGNEKNIIDLPLIDYLTAIRGFGDSWIKSDQEFLDRQSRWTLIFFLDENNIWIKTRVVVNNWTVRLNEAHL